MANSQKETIATVRLLVIEFGGLCKKRVGFCGTAGVYSVPWAQVSLETMDYCHCHRQQRTNISEKVSVLPNKSLTHIWAEGWW